MWFDAYPLGDLHELAKGKRATAKLVKVAVQPRTDEFRAAGFEPGHRVLLTHHDSIQFFIDLLAVWNIGACALPVRDENVIDAHWLVHSESPPQPLNPFGESWPRQAVLGLVRNADPARVTLHSAEGLQAKLRALAAQISPADMAVTLSVQSTANPGALIGNALFPWLSGAEILLAPAWDDKLLTQLDRTINQHAVNFFAGSPTLWDRIARIGRKLAKPTLRKVFSSGGMLSENSGRAAAAWAGEQRVWNVYSRTEFAGWITGAPVETKSLGTGWDAQLRLNADDLIELRAPYKMLADAPTAAPGQWRVADSKEWLATDDAGRLVGHNLYVTRTKN